MIDVRDLRIGNYVINENSVFQLRLNEDCELVWHFIGSKDFHFTAKQVKGKMKPIPIIPKWLVRFGFTRHSVDQWLHQDFPFIVEDDICFYSLLVGDVEDESGFAWLVTFKYVHELQNLIYALTKTELTIDSVGGEHEY